MNEIVLKLLTDILHASRRIQQFLEGVSWEDYASNELLQSAVERQFLIIGEAMARLGREAPDTFAQITDAPSIVGFRNVIVHGYDIVDSQVVWSAATIHLPTLLAEIQNLMSSGSNREGR